MAQRIPVDPKARADDPLRDDATHAVTGDVACRRRARAGDRGPFGRSRYAGGLSSR